jgi:hypothetical protein
LGRDRFRDVTKPTTMQTLLTVTAVIEAGAGLALTVSPSVLASVLLGTSLDTPTGLTIGRVAGAALLSLAIVCWLARNDELSRAVTGLIVGMSFYNAAVIAILIYAGIGCGLAGVGLWPAILAHAALLAWCIACFRMNRIKWRAFWGTTG